MELQYRLLHANARPPEYMSDGSAGMDLYVSESAELDSMSPTLVKTGVAVEIPEGYEGQLRVRSSTALKAIIMLNAPGTIDCDYRGELMGILMYLDQAMNAVYRVDPGDRVFQLVISAVARPSLRKVEQLSQTRRGAGRHGSTGT